MTQTFVQLHVALNLLLLGFKLLHNSLFGASFAINPSTNFSFPSFVDTVMLWKRDRRTSSKKHYLKRLTCGVPLVYMPNQKRMTLPCHSSSISTNGSKNEQEVTRVVLSSWSTLYWSNLINLDAPKWVSAIREILEAEPKVLDFELFVQPLSSSKSKLPANWYRSCKCYYYLISFSS